MLDWDPAYMLLWGFALTLPFVAQVSHIMEEGEFQPSPLLWVQLISVYIIVQFLIVFPAAVIMRYFWPQLVWNEILGLVLIALVSVRLLYISNRRRPLTVMRLHTGMIILLSLMSGLNVLIYTVGSQLALIPPRPLHVFLFLSMPFFVMISFIMASSGFRKLLAKSSIDLLAGALALGLCILWAMRLVL